MRARDIAIAIVYLKRYFRHREELRELMYGTMYDNCPETYGEMEIVYHGLDIYPFLELVRK